MKSAFRYFPSTMVSTHNEKIGESGVAVYGGQLQTAVDTSDILYFSLNRSILLVLLTVYHVTFLKQEAWCSWYTAKQ